MPDSADTPAITIPLELDEKLKSVQAVLQAAQLDPATFQRKARRNETIRKELLFSDLCSWLSKADDFQKDYTKRQMWSSKQRREKFGIGDTEEAIKNGENIDFNTQQDIYDALQLVAEIKHLSESGGAIKIKKSVDKRKKVIGRVIEINGVRAIELDVKQTENLNDPIVDVALRVNNPLGRIWLALRRMWKKQNTIFALKLTIPLLVLPIVLYAGYRIWQGRGVNTPVAKLGVIHQVSHSGSYKDVLISPSSDVYMLSYKDDAIKGRRIMDKPTIVIGVYNQISGTLEVTDVIAYSEEDSPAYPQTSENPSSNWQNLINFIRSFK